MLSEGHLGVSQSEMFSKPTIGVFAGIAIAAANPAKAKPPSDNFVGSLCVAVESKIEENQIRHDQVTYRYQQMLADVAGVGSTDPADLYNAKIARWVDSNMPKLLCNSINFNPRNGNLLKLAVARQNNSFIDDALTDWKINLNQIDATDGKTVLDYIEDRKASSGTESSFGKTLQRYWTKFRAAGAKRAAELR